MNDYWDELEKMEEERDAQEYAEAQAYRQGYEQGKAEAIEEFCSEIDLEEPMHFTKEQVRWIKKYVILKRWNVIDEFTKEMRKLWAGMEAMEEIEAVAEQLKEQKDD